MLRIPREGQLTPGGVRGNFSRQMILELDLSSMNRSLSSGAEEEAISYREGHEQNTNV